MKLILLLFLSTGIYAQSHWACEDQRLDVRSLVEKQSVKSNAEKVVSFYIEVDLATRNTFSTTEECEDWIKEKYLEMARIYGGEQISTALTSIRIPELPSEDWSPPFINNPFDLLNEFGRIRMDQPEGRLKMFLSMIGPPSSLAWVGTLESDHFTFQSGGQTLHAGPYSVNLRVSTGTVYDTIVMAHEGGHNFGSMHTHDCAWGNGNQAIDDCATPSCSLVEFPIPDQNLGTVMSNCHLTSQGIQVPKGFGDEPGDLLRNNVAQANRDLLEFEPIILYLAGEVSSSYEASDCVIFHPESSSDLLEINIKN